MKPLGICEAIASYARSAPDGRALVTDTDSLSWRELEHTVAVIAEAFRDCSLRPGDRVAAVTNAPFAFVAVCAAAEQCRCICAPLPIDYSQDVLQRLLRHFAPNVVVADREELGGSEGTLLSAAELVRAGRERRVASVRSDESSGLPSDPFIVLYTSGTTNAPRGTERDRRTCTAWWNILAEYDGLRFGSTTVVATPLAAGMGIGCILPTVVAGATCRFATPFNAERFIELSRVVRPTFTQLTPTHWALILDSPAFRTESFASYARILSGGARLEGGRRAKLVEHFPHQFAEQYGTSESGAVSLALASGPAAKRGSVGRPFPDAAIKILDGETEISPNVDGEVAVHTSRLMSGYFRDAEGTRDAWWIDPRSGTKFYRTGDVGRIDEDGYLWIRGRQKEVIISGGQNVYASDLEAALLRHPAVADVAVVPKTDRLLGEVPVAFVVLKPSSTATESDICRWANAHLRKAQRLYTVRVISAIPKNANGKPIKRLLTYSGKRAFESRDRGPEVV